MDERLKQLEILNMIVRGFMSYRFGDDEDGPGSDPDLDLVFTALHQVDQTGNSPLTYPAARAAVDVAAYLEAYYAESEP